MVAVIAATFALCLGYATLLLVEEAKTVRLAARSGAWMAVQAEIEFLRLHKALDHFALAGPEASNDELVQRFDIFWSRLPLILVGREGEPLRRLPGVKQEITRAIATLKSIEPDVLGLRPGDSETRARLESLLDPLGLDLHNLAQHAVIDLQDTLTRQGLNGALSAILVSLIGALAAGSLLVVMVVRGLVKTRKLMADEHAARLRAELADRSKSLFLANASHELRTPLNAIIGFSELIRNQTWGPIGSTRYLEYIHDIEDSGRNLLELINSILDLSKIDSGVLKLRESEVRLVDVVQSAYRIVRPRAAEKHVELSVTIDSDSQVLRCDARLLGQAVTHILGNAVKFTNPGGQVQIGVRFGSDGAIGLRVEDSGIGMSAVEVANALEPFAQADEGLERRYEGLGIGLPLARSIIELHGGRLEIDSGPGRGTLAILWLPSNRVIMTDALCGCRTLETRSMAAEALQARAALSV